MTGFDHEAVFYDGEEGFLAEMVPYVQEGIDAGEAVLVAVSKRKIGLMRERLGADADAVEFADMAAVGTNPARIIPVWRAVRRPSRGRRQRRAGHRRAGVGRAEPGGDRRVPAPRVAF